MPLLQQEQEKPRRQDDEQLNQFVAATLRELNSTLAETWYS